MYSLLSFAIEWLLDQVTSTKNSGDNDPNIGKDVEDSRLIPEDSPFLLHLEDEKTQHVEGKVTHIFHGHGLIEGDIYFSIKEVQGEDHNLKVGDSVQTMAVQPHPGGGWYARWVCPTQLDWAVGLESNNTTVSRVPLEKSTMMVGKVTSFQNGQGVIDQGIGFRKEACREDYLPFPGDWVSACVEETREELPGLTGWDEARTVVHSTAFQVSPLRHLDTEGQVTAVLSNHGFINEQIFFTTKECANGFKPQINDYVRAVCVESSQGKCQWRATFVVPLSSRNNLCRSKQSNKLRENNNTRLWLIRGQRPKFHQQLKSLPVKLPQFTIPDNLFQAVINQEELIEFCPQLKGLTLATYAQKMSTLLYLEEIQMQMDIREFDLNRVCLHPMGDFLSLSVPGLAEGRPSILIGDKVILSVPCDPEGPSYEGFVHELTSSDIHLKFSPEFHTRYNGEDYDVVFTFNRNTLRRSHQAVSLAVRFHGSKVLFPSQLEFKAPQLKLRPLNKTKCQEYSHSPIEQKGETQSRPSLHHQRHLVDPSHHQTLSQNSPPGDQNHSNSYSQSPLFSSVSPHNSPPRDHYRIYNSDGHTHFLDVLFFNQKLNNEQKAAVRHILLGLARPKPYVIFGPPGTGKTITVVEAILQLLTRVHSSRILACTPSNSAADLITERLHQSEVLKTSDVVRMNAFQRSTLNIPESILQYCQVPDDLKKLARCRIIICTCSMAGILYGVGLTPGHITHVVVDECGQATEPECLIPIGLLSGADGQIILAGDPKQLGPIVMSPFAKMYGLVLSFLERILNQNLYQRHSCQFEDSSGYNPVLVTMLRKNYRSHPSILNLSSKLFYFNELQPFAEKTLVTCLADWPLLIKAGDPVLFHGIRGEDVRESDNPSWFNPGETLQVVCYLQGLLREGLSPGDVGIITPYRKQVEKIRFMIERLGLPDVKVGSVEEFQGQERLAIIISTVRSNEKLLGFDVRHSLGFLSNPKRFNVAITRAQALLIIIGNPYVLAQDTNWKSLIQECNDRGVYTGCELPDLKAFDKSVNELIQ